MDGGRHPGPTVTAEAGAPPPGEREKKALMVIFALIGPLRGLLAAVLERRTGFGPCIRSMFSKNRSPFFAEAIGA